MSGIEKFIKWCCVHPKISDAIFATCIEPYKNDMSNLSFYAFKWLDEYIDNYSLEYTFNKRNKAVTITNKKNGLVSRTITYREGQRDEIYSECLDIIEQMENEEV